MIESYDIWKNRRFQYIHCNCNFFCENCAELIHVTSHPNGTEAFVTQRINKTFDVIFSTADPAAKNMDQAASTTPGSNSNKSGLVAGVAIATLLVAAALVVTSIIWWRR